MALLVGIMGPSGSGKTSSYETCDPRSTFVVNSDLKSLPFANNGFSVVATTDLATIYEKLNKINQPTANPGTARIRRIIFDTMNGIMVDDEMRRFKEVGYDKWQDLAVSVYDIIRNSHLLREDLIVYFMFHMDNWLDDDGIRVRRIKTNGKKLNKIELESMFTIVIASTQEGMGAETKYKFEIKPFGSTVKVPRNIFEAGQEYMDNDLNALDKRLREVYKLPDVPTPILGNSGKYGPNGKPLLVEQPIFFLRTK